MRYVGGFISGVKITMEANFNIIEAIKQSGTRKKKLVLKRGIKSNKMLEYDYYGIVKYMVTAIKESFENTVLKKFNTKAIQNLVSDAELPSLEKVLIEWQEKVEERFNDDRLKGVAEKYVNKVDRYQSQKFRTAVDYGFGIDISGIPEFREYKPFIKSEIKKNLSLLQDLKKETMFKLEMMLRKAIEQGTNPKEIGQEIAKIEGMQERRANLIARNEVKNIIGALTKKRMLNVGFEQAEWSSSQDERVRKEHKDFNNKVYKIGVGLYNKKTKQYEEPMSAINCRCVALALVEL